MVYIYIYIHLQYKITKYISSFIIGLDITGIISYSIIQIKLIFFILGITLSNIIWIIIIILEIVLIF